MSIDDPKPEIDSPPPRILPEETVEPTPSEISPAPVAEALLQISADRDAARRQVEALTIELRETAAESGNRRELAAALTRSIQEVREAKAGLLEEIGRLEEAVDSLKEQASDLQERASVAEKRLSDGEAELAASQEARKEADRFIRELKEEIRSLRRNLQEIRRERDEALLRRSDAVRDSLESVRNSIIEHL